MHESGEMMHGRHKYARSALVVAIATLIVTLSPAVANASNGCRTDGLPETTGDASDIVKMRSLNQLCTHTWIYVAYYDPTRPTTPTWVYEDEPVRIAKGKTRVWEIPGEIISAKFASVYVDPTLPVNPRNPGWSSVRTGSTWWRHN